MENPTISVCMMVKNEEEMLPRALESIKDLADELIIVDTGSTDRTIDISNSYGAKVYHHPWEFNFSKHRNQSIDYATKDWIFIIDADEELHEKGIELLREVTKNCQQNTISIPVFSIAQGGSQESSHNSVRMFRNHLGIRYDGAIHNEIVFEGGSEFVAAKLFHYGYDLSREKMMAKFNRTTDLLKREMEKDPKNPKFPHYLAVSYHGHGLFAEAFDAALLSYNLIKDNPELMKVWITTYYILSASLIELKQIEKAEEYCNVILDVEPDYLDAWAILTSTAFIKEQWKELSDYATRYMNLHKKYQQNPAAFGTMPLHALHHLPLVLARLAMSAKKQGDEIEFQQKYKEALEKARDKSDIVLAVTNYLVSLGNIDEALQIALKALDDDPSNKVLLEETLGLLINTGKAEQAHAKLENAKQAGLPEYDYSFLSGTVAIVSGDSEKAKSIFTEMLEKHPDDFDIKQNLAKALEKLDEHEQAEKLYLEIIQDSEDPLDAAINVGNLYIKLGRFEDAISFLEIVIKADPQLYDVHLLLTRLCWETNNSDKLFIYGVNIGKKLGLDEAKQVNSAEEMGDLFLLAGKKLIKMQNAQAGYIAFEMAKLLSPKNPEAHEAFAQSLLHKGDAAMAVSAFEYAIKLAPERWQPFEGLARCYEMLGVMEARDLSLEQVKKLKNS